MCHIRRNEKSIPLFISEQHRFALVLQFEYSPQSLQVIRVDFLPEKIPASVLLDKCYFFDQVFHSINLNKWIFSKPHTDLPREQAGNIIPNRTWPPFQSTGKTGLSAHPIPARSMSLTQQEAFRHLNPVAQSFPVIVRIVPETPVTFYLYVQTLFCPLHRC